MFLSAMRVDVGRGRPGRQWLRNLYRVHQRLWMGFADEARKIEDPFFLDVWSGPDAAAPGSGRRAGGFLFRIEEDGPARILVQSVARPDWDWAFQNAPGLLAEPPRVREFRPEFAAGRRLRFRLRANPVKRLRQEGRRVAVGGNDADLRAWLERKAARGGFALAGETGALIRDVTWTETRKSRDAAPIRFLSVLFEGVLEVERPEPFARTIAAGIGPAKAFGCGLLSVAGV